MCRNINTMAFISLTCLSECLDNLVWIIASNKRDMLLLGLDNLLKKKKKKPSHYKEIKIQGSS